METKTVYSFHPETRSFLGAVVLSEANGDVSPLEPGVWHIPGNCLEVAPPADVPAGKYAAAVDGEWKVIDVPVPVGVAATKAAAEKVLHAVQTPEMLAASLHAFIERHLDQQARVLRFNTIDEAVTYATCPAVPKFQGQGVALRTLRSKTWAVAEPLIDAVAAGGKPVKPDDLYKLLPIYDAAEAAEVERIAQGSLDALAADAAAAELAAAARVAPENTPAAVAAANAVATAAAAPASTRKSKKA